MDRALFLAMSGAKQDLEALQIHANNLANVSTTGFRSDLEHARSMQAYGEGFPSRVFTMTERPASDLSGGVIKSTGRDLDIAIKDKGWIAVQDSSGNESLTRAGSLKIESNGLLTNANGQTILGDDNAPIYIQLPISKVQIASDGTISILPQGAPVDALEQAGRIKLVSMNDNDLYKNANGLFVPKVSGTPILADANVKIESGFLEGSNVNAVGEMTNIIDLQRHYEMQIKLMKTAQDMDKASNTLMRLS